MTKVVTDGLRDLIRRYACLHSTVCSKSETSYGTSMDYKRGHVLKSCAGQRVHPQRKNIQQQYFIRGQMSSYLLWEVNVWKLCFMAAYQLSHEDFNSFRAGKFFMLLLSFADFFQK